MRSLTVLFVAALATANPVDWAKRKSRQAPPGNEITISSLVVSGSGCPTDSVSRSLSPDGTVVTLGFNSFQTFIGPNFTIADSSKNCQIHLSLQYPGGFTYSIVDAVYHGYAQLDAGVTGTFLSTYYFSQSAAKSTTTRSTISGPLDGVIYTKEDQVPTASIIWSPCGAAGILNIDNRISLTATSKTESGSVTDDDATVAFYQQVNVQWAKCPMPSSSSSSPSGDSFTTGPAATVLVPRETDNTGPDYSPPSNVFSIGPGATTVTEDDGATQYYGPPPMYGGPGGTTTIVASG